MIFAKGWVVKEVGKNNYYTGCKMGYRFAGLYGAKIYQKYENAEKGLKAIQHYSGVWQICEVRLLVKEVMELEE
jgi:hypothetical protein